MLLSIVAIYRGIYLWVGGALLVCVVVGAVVDLHVKARQEAEVIAEVTFFATLPKALRENEGKIKELLRRYF